MREFQVRMSHKPRPLPTGRWTISRRWNDLLFAHWPVPAPAIAALLPEGLQVDTFQGSAWLGIVPFWLDGLRVRGVPRIPVFRSLPDLNLQTYVREEHSGARGLYCFSMDAGSLLAVAAARTFYHLPYYWADMRLERRSAREFAFYSRRRFAGGTVTFQARYRGLGPAFKEMENRGGTLEGFFSERDSLYTRNREGQTIRANIHQVARPLEDAEAVIERNSLAETIGISLPNREPVLHYSRRMAVYVWPAELVRRALATRPVTVAATPSA